jgi:hypothetical protein
MLFTIAVVGGLMAIFVAFLYSQRARVSGVLTVFISCA